MYRETYGTNCEDAERNKHQRPKSEHAGPKRSWNIPQNPTKRRGISIININKDHVLSI
jgi:cell envelope opacity-associated protein A